MKEAVHDLIPAPRHPSSPSFFRVWMATTTIYLFLFCFLTLLFLFTAVDKKALYTGAIPMFYWGARMGNGNPETNGFDWLIKPRSQTTLQMGLLKSAFSARIYRNQPIDMYLPGINLTHETLKMLIRREPIRVKPKFYQLHDSFLMYYQPYETVVQSLKREPRNATVWWHLIKNAINTDDFWKLNQVTQGSQELSALAGARFFHNLVKQLYEEAKDHNVDIKQSPGEFLNNPMNQLNQQTQQFVNSVGKNVVKAVLAQVAQEVKEFKELKEEGLETAQMIAGFGGHGFSHEALSVYRYLQNPDDFRKRVRLLRSTIDMFRQFMNLLPTSLQHQQTISIWGGISGVDRMLRESQLKDILPSELVALAVKDEKLKKILKLDFLLRLTQKQVMVYQRSATIRPVIFIDKSGSMGANMPGSDIPKISMACGLALAIWMKYQGDVYFFDTELEGPIPRSRIVQVLLTIEADGGTRIEEALKEVLKRGRKDEIYIVISDGIDVVSQETIDELKKQGLDKNIRFILVPPSWEETWLKNNFRYWYARDIASFVESARKALSS